MIDALKAALEHYPAVGLIGFMTVSLVLALITIGLAARFMRSLAALKDYDVALEKYRVIEEKLLDMTQNAREVQMDYERSLAEEKAAHDREVFSLQQIIFERNAEVLTLKTEIMEMCRTHGHPFDVPPQ